MPAFPRFNIAKTPIIDTNLLFEFLVWRFFEEIPEDEAVSASTRPFSFQYLSSDELRVAFQWYVSRAKPIETSPHVIAEIHGLALGSKAHLRAPRLAAFWSFAKEELAQLGMEEHFVRVAEMDTNHVQVVGPTDTSLLQRAQQSGRTLLTGDRELRGRCIEHRVKVIDCWDVLACWQESR